MFDFPPPLLSVIFQVMPMHIQLLTFMITLLVKQFIVSLELILQNHNELLKCILALFQLVHPTVQIFK